jgi:pyruvate kinase
MVQALKKAQAQTSIPCKIYMDLAGPKFRVQLPGKGKDSGKMEISLYDLIPMHETDSPCLENERVISCHQPGIVKKLIPGSTILIDDGMIEAVVQTSADKKAIIQITRISGKPVIKAGKGINFPNTYIEANPLTKEDIFSLNFVMQYAHLVGYSFVRTPSDIAFLRNQINQLKGTKKAPHLIIKIETPESVTNLPNLLFEAMKDDIFGVMIARGDLAVEIGFERLSEIQEEILWLCEASHTPVIWATQVLEQLNKTGVASRSEITDAYKAAQAECIMVNKGNHLLEVLATLKNVAKRSRRHHLKKRYAMPPLQIASDFFKKKK